MKQRPGNKRSDHYTVMVFPRRGSRVRKYAVTRGRLRQLIAGVSVLGIATIASYFLAIVYVVDYPENNRIRLENTTLKTELHVVEKKVDEIEESISRVKQFDKKLRLITRLNDSSRNIAMGPVSTNGGRGPDYLSMGAGDGIAGSNGDLVSGEVNVLDSDLSFPNLGREESFGLRRIFHRLSEVYSQVYLEEQSVQELSELLRDQQSRLSATPSIWPVKGWVTSSFGYRMSPYTGLRQLHQGLDIATRIGTPIVTPADGVVTFVGTASGFGNLVKISHGYGLETVYGHNSRMLVKLGQRVHRGDAIAEVGNTGRATGPHCHYEVRVYGVPVDPSNYILN